MQVFTCSDNQLGLHRLALPFPPSVSKVTCAYPDNKFHWTNADVSELLAHPPPRVRILIWRCIGAGSAQNAVAKKLRAFYGLRSLRKKISHYADVWLNGAVFWFDFATLDAGCAADVLLLLERRSFFANTGMLVTEEPLSCFQYENFAHDMSESWKQASGISSQESFGLWESLHLEVMSQSWPEYIHVAANLNAATIFVSASESGDKWFGRAASPASVQALPLSDLQLRHPNSPARS